MRLLVVEDSKRLRESLSLGLRGAGYAVDEASDGQQGLWQAQSNEYDVIILDLMLPMLDGLSVLQRLRQAGNDTHVLILTAKDLLEDKVLGLRRGADDYLVKPFAFDELLARIEALIRRQHGRKAPNIVIGPIAIDTAARTVTREGTRLDISSREFSVLEFLAMRRGQIVDRMSIESHVYDANAELMSNVVDSVIYSLRKKIDLPGQPSLIRTRRGMGYEMVESVE